MPVLAFIRLVVAGFITLAASQESNVQEDASRVDLVTGVTFAEDHSKAKAGTLRGFYRTATVLAKLTPIELAIMWLYHYRIQQSASIDSSKTRDTINHVSDPQEKQEVNKESHDAELQQNSISLNLAARAEDDTLKLMLTCSKVFFIALLARLCIKRSCASTKPCDLETVMPRGRVSGLTRQRSPRVERSSTTVEFAPRKERQSNSSSLPAAPSDQVSSSASPCLADVMTPQKTVRRKSSRNLTQQVEKKKTLTDWLEGRSSDPHVQRDDAKRQEATAHCFERQPTLSNWLRGDVNDAGAVQEGNMERPGVTQRFKDGVKCTNLLSSRMTGA